MCLEFISDPFPFSPPEGFGSCQTGYTINHAQQCGSRGRHPEQPSAPSLRPSTLGWSLHIARAAAPPLPLLCITAAFFSCCWASSCWVFVFSYPFPLVFLKYFSFTSSRTAVGSGWQLTGDFRKGQLIHNFYIQDKTKNKEKLSNPTKEIGSLASRKMFLH